MNLSRASCDENVIMCDTIIFDLSAASSGIRSVLRVVPEHGSGTSSPSRPRGV